MDIIADHLGVDPVQFRRKNLLQRAEELKLKDKPLDAVFLRDYYNVTVRTKELR